jgi:hypothetical protein
LFNSGFQIEAALQQMTRTAGTGTQTTETLPKTQDQVQPSVVVSAVTIVDPQIDDDAPPDYEAVIASKQSK